MVSHLWKLHWSDDQSCI